MSDTQTPVPGIFQAMSAVMDDIGAVGKNGRNQQQGYAFRGIDDVMAAAHVAMVKHGVFYLPTVIQRISETRETKGGGYMNVMHLEIRYTFYAADGSHVETVVWGESSDSADKATNKAMSQALKYALVQAFSIPTQDLPDGDQETVEAAPARGYQRGQQQRESFDDARPAPSRNGQNGSPASGTVARPPAQERPAPTGEIDPDAQVFADEIAVALTVAAAEKIAADARTAGKQGALVRNPDSGKPGILCQLIQWHHKRLADIERALAELHAAAGAQKMPIEDLEIAVKHVTGKSIDDATAEQLRQVTKSLTADKAA